MAGLDVREFMHGSHSDIEDSSSDDEQPCHESEVAEAIDKDDEDVEINEETATNMQSTSASHV
ncbi:unnamed protein product [Orchesella dallaii]|uniref:Uncharacterized protein n=1 Tax=Orchesella dallaii TaxID=48710 RepID=A0ABP1RPI5_9HEXA